MFLGNGVLKKCSKFTGENPCRTFSPCHMNKERCTIKDKTFYTTEEVMYLYGDIVPVVFLVTFCKIHVIK